MNQQKVNYLLSQEEGPKLDFKLQVDMNFESGKKELAKDIIAIANTEGGRGHIIIGVKDKTKEVVGIGAEEITEERVQQILSLRCDPPIDLRVEHVDVENTEVCVITVFRSYRRPHQMRQTGAFYIRRGSTTDFARREEIASMLQHGGLINNEQIPLLNMSKDIYDYDLMRKYLEKMNIKNQETNYDLLCDMGFLYYDKDSDMYCPTLGGILIFCRNPQAYFPAFGIRILNVYDDFDEKELIKGNVFDLMSQTSAYFEGLNIDYPMEALDEAVFNAIIHRDYMDTSREIFIYISDEKIYISNPGCTHGSERINNLIHQHNPNRRNNWLYHKALALDDKERFFRTNTGLAYIRSCLKSYGSVRYINSRKTNMFKVVLPGLEHKQEEARYD